MVKYRELTEEEEKAFYETPEGKVALKEQEEERAFLETPEGKAILEKQEEERAYQYQEPALEEILTEEEQLELNEEYKKIKAEEEQEASGGGGSTGGGGKYKRKKYIDEDGVWIPRIVTFLITMLLFWIASKDAGWFDMFRFR